MEDSTIYIKLLVVGNSGVGKTSILNQYCNKKFDQFSSTTVGCDFSTKIITRSDLTIRLQLWDISGI